jgi:hypothetical protein
VQGLATPPEKTKGENVEKRGLLGNYIVQEDKRKGRSLPMRDTDPIGP